MNYEFKVSHLRRFADLLFLIVLCLGCAKVVALAIDPASIAMRIEMVLVSILLIVSNAFYVVTRASFYVIKYQVSERSITRSTLFSETRMHFDDLTEIEISSKRGMTLRSRDGSMRIALNKADYERLGECIVAAIQRTAHQTKT